MGAFLQELELKVVASAFPVLIGGDFNLIRGIEDKNNRNINWPRVHLFNDCIANLSLREIARTGAAYTWTNKQTNHVRSVLDRVFVLPVWELQFPLSSLKAENRLGSDHNPLLFDTHDSCLPKPYRFFFEASWLEIPGFKEIVVNKWMEILNMPAL